MSAPVTSDPAALGEALHLLLHDALDEELVTRLLTPAEVGVRDRVRRVVARDVVPRASAVDRDGTFAAESFRALADAGLVGLLFPVELGGTGDSTVAYAVAMEEIAAACPATSLIYMTQTHCAYPIVIAGSPELAMELVPRLLSGEHLGSMSITEPDAGSDAATLTTTAERRDDGSYVVTGSKTFVSTGDLADVIVCFARCGDAAGRHGITAFAIRGDAPGIVRGRPFEKMGMHGSSTSELFFTETPVPASHRLGEEGSGWDVLTQSVVKSRVSAAAQGIGIARGAFAHALVALTDRHGVIPEDLALRLAVLRSRLLGGRVLLHAVARHIDAGAAAVHDVAILKQTCTDLAWDVTVELTDLLGPMGDRAELGVERFLRDARVTKIYDGTNEIQALLVARDTARRLREVLV